MQDIYDKTDNNEKTFNKFTDLKFPPSKIFSGLPPTPTRKGVRRMSIGHNTSLINHKNYDTNQTNKEEIYFYNLNNKGYIIYNRINIKFLSFFIYLNFQK